MSYKAPIYLLIAALSLLWGGGPARGGEEAPGAWARQHLDPAEQAWLREHPVLRLGVGSSFEPIMYQERQGDGLVFRGMVSDYLRILEHRLGVRLEPQLGIEFSEALARGRARAIDLFPCLARAPDREQFLIFTKPYLSFPLVIFTRKDFPYVGSLADFEDRRLAEVEALAYYQRIKREYPRINFLLTESAPAALQAVSLGKADGYVVNLAVGAYYIEKLGLANLKVAAPSGYGNNELAMAVRSDWPILAGILEKALAGIDQHAKDMIQQRWIAAPLEAGLSREQVLRWGLVVGVPFLLLLALTLFWNRRLKREAAERQRAEAALQASEARLLKAQSMAHVGNWEIDLASRTMWGSQEAARIYGLSPQPEQRMDLAAVQAIPLAEERARLDQALADLLAGRAGYDIEFRIRRQDDGQLRHIHSRAELVRGPDGQPARVVGTIQDVTESRLAGLALQKSEQRYRELLDSVHDLIYTQDLDGRFTSFNRALSDILGFQAEQMLGRRAAEFMKPELRAAFDNEYLANILRTGEHSGVSMYFHKDGSRRYLEYKSQLAHDAQGRAYISGIARDVTERITQQKRLRQLQEQLLQAQKMEAVGVLAGGVAHDFNNILQAISGYTQVLRGGQGLDERAREHLDRLEQAVHRGADLVHRLLTFGRKAEKKPRLMDLNHELEQVVKLLERALPRMITIQLDLAPDLWPILADPIQLEQVVINLANNARDAMPEGGVLTLRTKNLHLGQAGEGEIVDLAPGDYAVLEVADTGHGMAPETLAHVFEPFFTTKEVGRGTGLGLATVYGIVKSHGGHVTCHSQPGGGARFVIHLPAGPEPAPRPAPRPRPDAAAPGGSETILLVDDEEDILATGREALEGHGYRVLTAGTGEAALAAYQGDGQTADLVILDLSMPGMGGLKCLARLKEIDPNLKVLLATGFADEAVQAQARALGVEGILSKPYRFGDLLASVRAALDAAPG
ncbi:MAG: PAS domain S-box protein [Thermodesulfobacteriota bacterium]